jgi:glycerol-3-phosphate dehydrogenase
LIGTTDVEWTGRPGPCVESEDEVSYLLRAANRYFSRQITVSDVVWNYCGIRPLFDDGSTNLSAVTRDYVLRVDGGSREAPVLSVFGGKITTYRRLSEQVMEKLAPWFGGMGPAWTRRATLPGGEMPGGLGSYAGELAQRYPALPQVLLETLARRHGALATRVLGEARVVSDLGEHFGAGLYAREIEYFIDCEWAHDVEDILWRRTKAGLHLAPGQAQAVARFVRQRTGSAMR